MRVRMVRRPGQAGTQSYVAQYGSRLVCVRYRYDRGAKRRYTTVEVIVEEGPWAPPLQASTLVAVRVLSSETSMQRVLRQAGAIWDRGLRVWQLQYDQAIALGLAERVLGTIDELLEGEH